MPVSTIDDLPGSENLYKPFLLCECANVEIAIIVRSIKYFLKLTVMIILIWICKYTIFVLNTNNYSLKDDRLRKTDDRQLTIDN